MNHLNEEQPPQPENTLAAPVFRVELGGDEPPPLQISQPEPSKPQESSAWKYILGVASLIAYVVMLILGGGPREFALTGLEIIPFALLAILAYWAANSDNEVATGLTIAYCFALVGLLILFAWFFTIGVLRITGELSLTGEQHGSMSGLELALRIGGSLIASILSGGLGLTCLFPAVRRFASRFIDIDPSSIVHAAALTITVAAALIFFIPLLAVNEPPALTLIKNPPADFPDADQTLWGTMYVLIWSVPASFVAVGFPRYRGFRQTRERLGLVLPAGRHLVVAVVAVGGLLISMHVLDIGIGRLWDVMGWNRTDAEAVAELFKFGAGPVAAFLVALSAGLGEEVVFRGVLQPRLGILLPAVMFTSVHALQYNFDALLQVLILGMTFGVIRKYTNTTTCVLIHGGYDCVLLLDMYLNGGVK
jgi:membrane protease YdiL (CAAX protease family)